MAIGGIILFEFMLPDQGAAAPARPRLAWRRRGARDGRRHQPRRRAARRPAAPRGRRREKGATMKTIDADGHVIEPADLWERELPPSLRGARLRACAGTPTSRQEEVYVEAACLLPFGIVGVGMAGRAVRRHRQGRALRELMPGGFDPQAAPAPTWTPSASTSPCSIRRSASSSKRSRTRSSPRRAAASTTTGSPTTAAPIPSA